MFWPAFKLSMSKIYGSERNWFIMSVKIFKDMNLTSFDSDLNLEKSTGMIHQMIGSA